MDAVAAAEDHQDDGEHVADADPAKYELEEAVSWLHAVASGMRSHAGLVHRAGGARYCMETLIHCVLQADLLRNQTSMRKNLLQSIKILVPAPLQSALEARLWNCDGAWRSTPQRETVRACLTSSVHMFFSQQSKKTLLSLRTL